MTEAHDQQVTHRYLIHYPAHAPREGDPHYRAFNAYHRAHAASATCYVGDRIGYGSCSPGPLELHHAHVEFSLQNGVDPVALAVDVPHLSPDATEEQIAEWVESDENFRWLCVFHHRGHGGAHTAAHSDWEAGLYVRGLIS